MRFWDSSAIVPLLIDESTTIRLQSELAIDPHLSVWWATPVECASAVARRQHAGLISASEGAEILARLAALAPAWQVMEPVGAIRETAIRLLRTHDLRAADALQLAAAYAASEGRPPSLIFISLDARLNAAASREGFRLADLAT